MAQEPSPAWPAERFQVGTFNLAVVSIAGARQGRDTTLKTVESLGTLVSECACMSTPASPAVSKGKVQKQNFARCQVYLHQIPKGFWGLSTCAKGSVPGPGQFRAGLS